MESRPVRAQRGVGLAPYKIWGGVRGVLSPSRPRPGFSAVPPAPLTKLPHVRGPCGSRRGHREERQAMAEPCGGDSHRDRVCVPLSLPGALSCSSFS